MTTGFMPLIRQQRYYAIGAWTQHMLFVAVHLGGSAALAAVAVRSPKRLRGLIWPASAICGVLSSLAIYYHYTAARDIEGEFL